jgi:hypothetical protein
MVRRGSRFESVRGFHEKTCISQVFVFKRQASSSGRHKTDTESSPRAPKTGCSEPSPIAGGALPRRAEPRGSVADVIELRYIPTVVAAAKDAGPVNPADKRVHCALRYELKVGIEDWSAGLLVSSEFLG